MNARTKAVIQYIIEKACCSIEPKKIYLFGSRARGDFRENSDFDFAFEFDEQRHQKDWARFCLDVTEEAPTLLSIDLVNLNDISDKFKQKIYKEGKIVFSNDA